MRIEQESRQWIPSLYAKKAAPTARTRPPTEIMLAAAAPVDSGMLAEEVPLAPPEEAVDAGLEGVPEAEPLLGLAEEATGTLVLPAGGATEVTRVGTTTGTELTAAGMELGTAGAEEGTTTGVETS